MFVLTSGRPDRKSVEAIGQHGPDQGRMQEINREAQLAHVQKQAVGEQFLGRVIEQHAGRQDIHAEPGIISRVFDFPRENIVAQNRQPVRPFHPFRLILGIGGEI